MSQARRRIALTVLWLAFAGPRVRAQPPVTEAAPPPEPTPGVAAKHDDLAAADQRLTIEEPEASPSETSREATSTGTEGKLTGHQRMLTWLAQIAERTDEENFFLGTRALRQAEEQLHGLPADAPLSKRLQSLNWVGFHELRLGANDRAIERFAVARDLAVRPPGSGASAEEAPSAEQVVNTLFQLAVAYLRLGEQQNCVAMHSSESCILPIRGAGVHKIQTG